MFQYLADVLFDWGVSFFNMLATWPSQLLVYLWSQLPEHEVTLAQPFVDALKIANTWFPCEETLNLAVAMYELRLLIIVTKWTLKFIPFMGG